MAHIAIVTSGLTGILNSSFEVVSRLEAEGHRITYLCPDDARSKVEDKGISYVQLPHINFEYWPFDNKLILAWPKRMTHHYKNLKSQNELGKQTLRIKRFQEELIAVSPDRLIIDVELHELIYSALTLRIPFALLSPWFPNFRVANVPPITTDIVPGIGFKGSRIGIAMVWSLAKAKARIKISANRLLLKNYRRIVLKKYAKELKIEPSLIKISSFPPVFHYKKWPTLHMVLRETDFPQENLLNAIYVGPMVFDKRDIHQETEDVELLNIFESRNREGIKIIYCSVSTLNKGDDSFISKTIDAVRGQHDWFLIVSLGGKLKKSDFKNIPPNVLLKEWVPQLEILKNTDCSINHGGINTINECIHFEVPMLIYSGKRHDQDGCAARIAYHNMGLMGDKDVDTSDQIKNKIDSLLRDPKYVHSMREMGEKYELTRRKKLSHLIDI